jgi:adenine deaminase
MPPRTKEELAHLVRAALGEVKADLVVRDARVVNVYSGEILEPCEVAVSRGRICYVGPSAAHTLGPETEILDAGGAYLAPGFIDAHTHIGHFCRPYEYLQAFVERGTTALVASSDELGSVFGFRGARFFLDEVRAHPLRVFSLVTMCAPQDPALCGARSLSAEEVAALLEEPDVIGLGEVVAWARLLAGDEELLARIAAARSREKIVHGHTAGAQGRKLAAIAAAGVSSCHEPIRAEEAIERLRMGYWLMLREGTIRQDLAETLPAILARRLDTERLILVTDSMTPDDVESLGHMDHVLRRAVALGLDPVCAIRCVTLHPAVYSGLDEDLGGIAPGRWADMVLLEELRDFRVRATLIGGKVVAEEGRSLVASRPVAFPPDFFGSLRLEPEIAPDAFRVPRPAGRALVRVMELANRTITRERLVEWTGDRPLLEADAERDLLKVAVFDRHDRSGRIALGFVAGFGARVGAVGLTVNLDENTLLVAGLSDADMALSANRIVEAGGGIAVVDRGETIGWMELPVGGLFGLGSWREAGRRLERIDRLLRERGSPFAKPLYALAFLTFVTLPSLRITDRGLVRVKERRFVPLLAEPGEKPA